MKQILIIRDLQRRGPRDDMQEEARLGWSGRTGRRANPRSESRGCLVGRSLHALLGRDDKRAGRDDKRGLSRDDKGSFRTVHCSCHCNHSMPAVISSGARRAESRNLNIGGADRQIPGMYRGCLVGRSLHSLRSVEMTGTSLIMITRPPWSR